MSGGQLAGVAAAAAGVVFPASADGRRSSTALGRAVVADALGGGGPAGAPGGVDPAGALGAAG